MKVCLTIGLSCVCLLFGVLQGAFAQSGLRPGSSVFEKCVHVGDPHSDQRGGNFLPGKYYQIKAHAYLDKGDTEGALGMFERAAYYGNKDALYEMAMIYLRGATKISVDVPRGLAWMRLASEYQQSDAKTALQKMDSALTEEQRRAADSILLKLADDYSISTTQRRARLKFTRERGQTMTELAGSGFVCQMDGTVIPGSQFYAQMNEEYADYASTMFGKVDVGPIEEVAVPPDDKK